MTSAPRFPPSTSLEPAFGGDRGSIQASTPGTPTEPAGGATRAQLPSPLAGAGYVTDEFFFTHPSVASMPPIGTPTGPLATPGDGDFASCSSHPATGPSGAVPTQPCPAWTTGPIWTRIQQLAHDLNPAQSDRIVDAFVRAVERTLANTSEEVRTWRANLPADWYNTPWKYVYPHHYGVRPGQDFATFADLERMLPILAEQGYHVLEILPHQEGPQADGGYDFTSLKAAKRLGGQEAFERFLAAARRHNIAVITDLPGNHTSTLHPWFQAAAAGDPKYQDYYVRCHDLELQGYDEANQTAYYRRANGEEFAETVIFPHAAKDHFIHTDNGKFWHTFYPFQADLDLRNPDVFEEILNCIGDEYAIGVAGRRHDAANEWARLPGEPEDDAVATHAVHGLCKIFGSIVAPGSIIVPEVVKDTHGAAPFYGKDTDDEGVHGMTMHIGGREVSQEGDAQYNWDIQARLRAMLLTQKTKPFWEGLFRLARLGRNCSRLNLLQHHDQSYLFGIQAEWVARLMLEKGGLPLRSNDDIGGRLTQFLDNNPDRIAVAMACLYYMPGIPVMYGGFALNQRHNTEFMASEIPRRKAAMEETGFAVESEAQVADARDLNRGPISAERLEAAHAENHKLWALERQLNEIRANTPALRDGDGISDLPCGCDDVLSALRFVLKQDGDEASELTPSALCYANIGRHHREYRLSIPELRDKLQKHAGFKGDEVLTRVEKFSGTVAPAIDLSRDEMLTFRLEPYQYLLFELHPQTA